MRGARRRSREARALVRNRRGGVARVNAPAERVDFGCAGNRDVGAKQSALPGGFWRACSPKPGNTLPADSRPKFGKERHGNPCITPPGVGAKSPGLIPPVSKIFRKKREENAINFSQYSPENLFCQVYHIL